LRGGLCSAEEATDGEATTDGEMTDGETTDGETTDGETTDGETIDDETTDDEVVGAGGDESDDVKLFDGFLIGFTKSLGGIGVSLLVKPGRRIGAAGAGAR
jgi:hypothetical protein